jgi:hypothetical protein
MPAARSPFCEIGRVYAAERPVGDFRLEAIGLPQLGLT